MSRYVAGGTGAPIISGSFTDAAKQVPGPLPDNAYDRTVATTQHTLQKRPNGVVVGSLTGDVGFFFGTSASFTSNIHSSSLNNEQHFMHSSSNYTNMGALASGTTLNIHPTAWSGSSGDIVTFIYKSGLSGGGV